MDDEAARDGTEEARGASQQDRVAPAASTVPVRTRLVVALASLVFVAEIVCGLFPAPGKYPYGVPLVVVLTTAFSAVRLRSGDDVSAYLAVPTSVAALAAWTLVERLGWSVEAGFGLFAALVALPAGVVVLALVRSGSADHPDLEG